MLSLDNNRYISKVYQKSIDLNYQKEEFYNNRHRGQQAQQDDDEEEENEDQKYERMDYKFQNEAKQYNKSVYNDIKSQKANDVYIFEEIIIPKKKGKKNQPSNILTHNEKYIPYERKKYLKEAIEKVMAYQESTNSVDYHPSINDVNGKLKDLIQKEMKKQKKKKLPRVAAVSKNDKKGKEKEEPNTSDIVKIRNIIHQSLQPYNEAYAKPSKKVSDYFNQKKPSVDQWGKATKESPSEFLWLPAEFVYSKETKLYEVQGKLFNPLEDCPDFPGLKDELNQLLTYFSGPLIQTHKHFKTLNYSVMSDYSDFNHNVTINDVKSKVDFSEKIHAIVKIAEMEIQPNSTYSGQWHVEGFSSDSILYTCLYVIEHDENLVEGRLKFKRATRGDDVPGDPYSQIQSGHSYCPSYQYFCDPNKLIPLGSLYIKEDLMIIFPNQNIHKVKGIKNTTDKPLKRKIIAFFVVNHVEQPITLNDIEFTKPIEVIKEHRFTDMYERSKNKQTDTQQFNYCEH